MKTNGHFSLRTAAATVFALAATSAVAQEPAASTNSVGQLVLDNGERFRGELTALDKGILRWTHPDAIKPFGFEMKHVSEIIFDGRPELSTLPTGAAVTFRASREGGEAQADATLVALDDRTVRLKSPVTGEFAWPRPLLKSIVFPHAEGRVVVGGLVDTNAWTAPAKNGEPWQFKGDRWISLGRGLLSRQVDMPDKIRLDADFEMTKVVHTRIGLYVPDTTKDFREMLPGYYLEYRPPGDFGITRVDANNRNRGLPNKNRISFRPGSFHVTLFVNKAERTFVLFVNGRRLADWKDEVNNWPADRGVSVTAFMRPMEIGALTIREWHGNLASITPPQEGLREDAIYLVDGKRLDGHVESVTNGTVSVAAVGGRVTHPLARIERIDFATTALPADDAQAGAFNLPPWRIFCADGAELPMRIDTLAGDALQGVLTGGSPCSIKLADVRRILLQAPAEPATTPNPAGGAGSTEIHMGITIQPR